MPSPVDHEEFNRKLREAFAIEAEEHLQATIAGVLELEKQGHVQANSEVLEQIFREAHSLKGAARAVNRTDIEALCQALESVFAAWKRQPAPLTPGTFDALYRATDLLTRQLTLAEALESVEATQELREVIARLSGLEDRPSQDAPAARIDVPASPTLPSPASSGAQGWRSPASVPLPSRLPNADTVRVPVLRLNALLHKAEGLIAAKLATRQRAAELVELSSTLETWRREWNKAEAEAEINASSRERREARSAEFLAWSRTYLQLFEGKVGALTAGMQRDEKTLSGQVDELLADAKKLVMLPASTLLAYFPKQIRDLAREQGKEIDFIAEGRDVEMDKRILDELRDPLVHLMRNAIDHGIEHPAQRVAAGKPRRGTLLIAVSRWEGNKILVEVRDDGAGLDAERVKASAIRQGVISKAEALTLSGETAFPLIFQSGVSTSTIITEISGRGLGMAIVRETVEQLGGQISLKSQPGAGTSFRLLLPVTLASFKGILVLVGGQPFVVPSAAVTQIVRLRRSEITSAAGRPAILLASRLVPLAYLHEVLELPATGARIDSDGLELVVLNSGDSTIAFVVDEVLAEEEVLVKPLRKPLVRVRNIASAALLGTGTPALVLHVGDLMQSAIRFANGPRANVPMPSPEATQRRLLVADDSVTSRMLLRNILETAGYEVATAVDGLEAFAALQQGSFDLLVTDGEMPRVNGFELTCKVRADKRLAALPVVVVTALGTAEDRARGIDAGANAYIVKSSFDQSNLLDLIRQLIA